MPWIPAVVSAVGAVAGSLRKSPKFNMGQLREGGFVPAQTPFSQKLWSGEGGYGYVNIDPSIREIRRQTLTRIPGYRSDINAASSGYMGNLGNIQQEYESNMNPWMQARLNPLRARIAQGRGELIQGMSRRGIFGPLYAQGLGNYDAITSREEADQGALATNEQQMARLGINREIYQGAIDRIGQLRSLDQAEQAVVAQDLQQELAALGLSQSDIGAALGAAGLNYQMQVARDERIGRALSAVGSAFGGIASGSSGGSWGNYGGVDWAKGIGLS